MVMVRGHPHFARAIDLPGNRARDLEQDDANFIETLDRLHKSDVNQPGWILLVDGFAGSLNYLRLSGTLLWTRLAGPRLLSAACWWRCSLPPGLGGGRLQARRTSTLWS
jgi:hypothetical protein